MTQQPIRYLLNTNDAFAIEILQAGGGHMLGGTGALAVQYRALGNDGMTPSTGTFIVEATLDPSEDWYQLDINTNTDGVVLGMSAPGLGWVSVQGYKWVRLRQTSGASATGMGVMAYFQPGNPARVALAVEETEDSQLASILGVLQSLAAGGITAADGAITTLGSIGDDAEIDPLASTATLAALARGILYTLENPIAPLPAGENHIGATGGNTASIRLTLTVNTNAYSAGNCVAGLIHLTNVMRKAGGSGVLLNLSAIEVGTQEAPLSLLFFSRKPIATFADHAAFPTLALADAQAIVGVVQVAAADYTTVGGVSTAVESGGAQALISDAGTDLWLAINTSGTPTFAAANALSLIIGISQD